MLVMMIHTTLKVLSFCFLQFNMYLYRPQKTIYIYILWLKEIILNFSVCVFLNTTSKPKLGGDLLKPPTITQKRHHRKLSILLKTVTVGRRSINKTRDAWPLWHRICGRAQKQDRLLFWTLHVTVSKLLY